MGSVNNRVEALIKEKAFTDFISKDMSLKEDLGIDSLRLVELIAELEDMFDIELEMSDLDPNVLVTVDSINSMISKYIPGDYDDAVSLSENKDGKISE